MRRLCTVWLSLLVYCALSAWTSGLPVTFGEHETNLRMGESGNERSGIARSEVSSSVRQVVDDDHDHEGEDDHDHEGEEGGAGEGEDDHDHEGEEGGAVEGEDDHDHEGEDDHDHEGEEGGAVEGEDDHDHEGEDDHDHEGEEGGAVEGEDDHDHEGDDHDHEGEEGDEETQEGEDDHDHGDHDHGTDGTTEGECDSTCQGWKIGFLFFILAAGLIGGFLPLLFTGKGTVMTKVSEALFMCSGGVLLAISLLDITVHAIEDLGPFEEEYWKGYPYALTIIMTGFLLDHLIESVGSYYFERYMAKRRFGSAHPEDATEVANLDEKLGAEDEQVAVYAVSTELESGHAEAFSGANRDADEATAALDDVDSLDAKEEMAAADVPDEKALRRDLQNFIAAMAGYIALSLHSVLAGLSLGLGDWETAVSFFIAIISHKSFGAFAAATNYLKSKPKMWQFITAVVAFSLVTPIGIAIGMGLTGLASKVAVGTLQALSAGMLIYVGTVHTLCHNDGKLAPLWEYLSYLSGAVIITIVTVIITFTGEGHVH